VLSAHPKVKRATTNWQTQAIAPRDKHTLTLIRPTNQDVMDVAAAWAATVWEHGLFCSQALADALWGAMVRYLDIGDHLALAACCRAHRAHLVHDHLHRGVQCLIGPVAADPPIIGDHTGDMHNGWRMVLAVDAAVRGFICAAASVTALASAILVDVPRTGVLDACARLVLQWWLAPDFGYPAVDNADHAMPWPVAIGGPPPSPMIIECVDMIGCSALQSPEADRALC
jgi:hypothetical protein